MTSTYDHRIIQGAESGRFLALIEELPAGRARLLRGASSPRSASSSGRAAAARAAAAAAARGAATPRASGGAASEELLQAVQARQHARQPRPQPRPPRRAPGPARLRARGRPGPRPGGARADAGDPGADPGEDLPDVRAGRDARRRAAAPARDLLRHDRLRDRAHRLPPPARVAARAHRVGRVPPAADRATSAATLLKRLVEVDALERFMHKAYLGQHQFSIEGLDMTVPMLDELIQLSAAHGGQRGRDRHGPPRAAERARPQPRPRLRHDLRRVRGRLDARGGDHDPAGRHRRRQVPPRHPGHLPAARRRHDPRQPRVQPEPPRVRLAGRRGRHARGADHAPGTRTPTRTPTRRCRS